MIVCILASAAEADRFVFASANWNAVFLDKTTLFLQLDYVIDNRHAFLFRQLKVHWVM